MGLLCYAQVEVRGLAAQVGLPNQARPDSQGICFLGKARPSLPALVRLPGTNPLCNASMLRCTILCM